MKKILFILMTICLCACSEDVSIDVDATEKELAQEPLRIPLYEKPVTADNLNDVCHAISNQLYTDFNFQYSVTDRNVTRSTQDGMDEEIIDFYPEGNIPYSVIVRKTGNGESHVLIKQNGEIINDVYVQSKFIGENLYVNYYTSPSASDGTTRGLRVWSDCMMNILTNHECYVFLGVAAALDPTRTATIIYGAFVGVAALGCAG